MGRRLRGGLVGCGFIAEHGHLPTYAERAQRCGDFEIVALADICAGRRARMRELFPDALVYEDHAQLLSAAASNLDFLDVTAPPYCHADIVRDALLAGLHVLCETPIATSTADARSMVERATRARRVLFPCHDHKHAPVIKVVRSMLEASAIGRVRLATLQTFATTYAKGASEWRPDWRRERRYSGGGIAMDHGSHTFYLALEWLGSHPLSISAKTARLGSFETEDNFSCTMTFPAALATVQLTWTAGARKVHYALHGERGAITVDDDAVELVLPQGEGAAGAAHLTGRRKVLSQWADASHREWFDGVLDEFAAAIDKGEFASAETLDAVRCIGIVAAAYGSAARQSREIGIADPLLPSEPPMARGRAHLKLARAAPDG